jgi:LPPG:FO 2-phospho-L-lactate transferase
MRVTALAGGIGAGKFLRGLIRAVPPEDLTVIVNTGDDFTLHGLHISPDLDSVTYWMAGLSDTDRGWGRRGETFRTLEELRRLGGEAWFGLGDLDLATHMARTQMLAEGRTLTEATDQLRRAVGIRARILPMTDDRIETRVDCVDEEGRPLDLHFQDYWVRRGARDEVKAVRFEGADRAEPAPGVLEAVASAQVALVCPSNPVVSIAPILAVPGIRDALASRRDRVAGVSPIVAGAPIQGMADRLMPSAGLEVSAFGAASAYGGVISGWVIDRQDEHLAGRIEEELGLTIAVTDTIMTDDAAAERVARTALNALEP